MRNVVSLKDVLAATVRGRVDPKQIISMAGNRIQGIQFASVGGLTYHLISEKGPRWKFSTDWPLQDIRN